jgi:hypothetical protein
MMPMRPWLIIAALALAAPAGLAQEEAPPRSAAEATPRPAAGLPFASPEDGFAALATAIAAHDEARLLRILGTAGRALVLSGDRVADRAARNAFTARYQQRQSIERIPPNRAMLLLGADDWPLALPMAERAGVWRFDARAGAQELIDRRVGRNELNVIASLRAIVAAQFEYAASAGRQGPWRAYARRFFSTPGQRDGLYWASAEGEPESPLGPLAAQAALGGYGRGVRDGTPRAFHGYFFRMLEAQGPTAPGGARDYLVDGRMIGGFAVVAWPARYGASGIQSFIVSHSGVVYQADLGPRSEERAARISSFDPDEDWSVAAP